MRDRNAIWALLALLLVALAATPAAAEIPETRTAIPIEFEFGPVINPCTGEETVMHITANWEIHALPSINSYFSGDFTHANEKITGQAVGEDGYAMEWGPFVTWVTNKRGDHYVESKAETVMLYGEDGGKYRVRRPLKAVVVDGDIKVSFELDDAVCIRPPKS